MLGACRVSTQTCLLMVVQKVLDVLSKYPQDKFSAFGCMQRIGAKHPEICMSLVTQLLQDHPFFDSAEKDVEDPACMHDIFSMELFRLIFIFIFLSFFINRYLHFDNDF